MLSYSVYKVMHLVSLLALLMSLGGLMLGRINHSDKNFKGKRWAMIFHGVSLFFVLLGGFGLLARLNIHTPWPGWIWVKLGLWLLLGGVTVLILRKPEWSRALWVTILLIAGYGVYVAHYKPF